MSSAKERPTIKPHKFSMFSRATPVLSSPSSVPSNSKSPSQASRSKSPCCVIEDCIIGGKKSIPKLKLQDYKHEIEESIANGHQPLFAYPCMRFGEDVIKM